MESGLKVLKEDEKKKARISWSQFSMYRSCPHRWELNYARKMRKFVPSIHLIFGTAMHEVLQEYLDLMFNKSIKEANEYDMESDLMEKLKIEYNKMVAQCGGEHFSTADQLAEFYQDGINILDYFKKKRGAYFSKKGYKLIGIEIPISLTASEVNENVNMIGFLDLVIEDTRDNRLIIYDIKTSTQGWNKWAKADPSKTEQLVLYKSYYSKQYGFPVEKIDVRYFIVKRRLYENVDFPQRRIQEFVPSSGTVTRNRLKRDIDEFVSSCFNQDGSYNLEKKYIALCGKNNKNCKWCEWKDDHDMCNPSQRVS